MINYFQRGALIDQHFMHMNNVCEPYQHAGSLQLFKLHKAIKLRESKQQKEPLILFMSSSILGFYPLFCWEDTSTLKLNRDHNTVISSHLPLNHFKGGPGKYITLKYIEVCSTIQFTRYMMDWNFWSSYFMENMFIKSSLIAMFMESF